MKIHQKAYNNLFIVLSFLLISYIGMLIMLYYHFIPGAYDQFLHINRIAELKESIDHLTLPQFSYNYLRGSSIMTLYPYINLIPIAILSFLIKSKVLLIYVSFSFYIFITLLISFYSSIKLSKSWRVSYLFAIIYAMSLMYINYTFVAADLGTAASLTWLPLVIFGFIKSIKYKKKWMELSIGLSLIIGSHVLSAIIVITLLVFWSVINIKKINWVTIINMVKAIMFSLLITAIIWLPLLSFMIDNPSFVRPSNSRVIWIFSIPISFLLKDSVIGTATEGIGIFSIIEIIMGLMFYRHFDRFEKQMYIISIIIILFSSTLFPWHYIPLVLLNFLKQFQFVTRFYIIPQLMLSYLFANNLIKIFNNKRTKNYLLLIISLIAIGMQLKQQQRIMSITNNGDSFKNVSHALFIRNKNSKFNKAREARLKIPSMYKINNNTDYNNILNVGNDFVNTDYWPSSHTEQLVNAITKNYFLIKDRSHHRNYNNITNYNNTLYEFSNSFKVSCIGFNRFSFYAPKKSEIMLPMFYYHGEKFKIYDNNKPIDIKENAGMISIKNPKKGNNVINIHPLPSYNYDISKKLTLIGLLGYVVSMFIFVFKVNFKKKK